MALLAALTVAAGCARAQRPPQAAAPAAASAAPPRAAAPHTPGSAAAAPHTPGTAGAPPHTLGTAGAPPPASAAPRPAAAVTPGPAAAVTPGTAAAVTPAGPQVLSVSTSPDVIHDGEAVAWDVRTTPDVVSVTAHVSAYTLPLVRRSAGRYTLDFSVPANVPGFFHGTYTLDIVARTESGATADRVVSVTFK